MKFEKEDFENLFRVLSYEKHDLEKIDFNREVNPVFAAGCIKHWQDHFYFDANRRITGIDAPNIIKSYTETITFASPDLLEWMVKVCDQQATNTNNIKICLGVYTAAMVKEYKMPQEKTGRLTAFLWPYCDDKQATYINKLNPGPVPPYNIGSLYP